MTRSISEKIDYTVLFQGCHGQILNDLVWVFCKKSISNNEYYLFFKFQKPRMTRSFNRELRVCSLSLSNLGLSFDADMYFAKTNIGLVLQEASRHSKAIKLPFLLAYSGSYIWSNCQFSMLCTPTPWLKLVLVLEKIVLAKNCVRQVKWNQLTLFLPAKGGISPYMRVT